MGKRVALAYSGGLDTCWCIPHLRDQGFEVVTVTVDVGGFSESELSQIAERSQELGAVQHILVPAADKFFDEVIRFLIFGNVLRGGVYPLCVGAERSLQARESAFAARRLGCEAVAHGCTAAGNDQIRFEVALRSLAPDLQILAPVRDLAPSRPEQVAFLKTHGMEFPSQSAEYSVNSGLWGVTIGGRETKGTSEGIPDEAWLRTRGAFSSVRESETLVIGFSEGIPTSLNGLDFSPVELIQKLDVIGGAYGIGRGIHLGETILGIKGRVAFEATAATLLLSAHRELEKAVLTKRQQTAKDMMAALYGDYVHEGLFTEPACRDIEALLLSSQKRVSGSVTMTLRTGSAFVEGVTSPYSLHAASRAVYGEAVGEWTPEDARGFGRLHGLAGILHARVGADS